MTYYDDIEKHSKGAWVVHHGRKTAGTVNGAAEFPALDTAGKAASLLSQIAATAQSTLEAPRVEALARAAGLNPRLELPELVKMFERRRLVSTSADGGIEVLGLTSHATVQHAAEIFEEQNPTPEERAAIAIAELTSEAPVLSAKLVEFVSDEFRMPSSQCGDFMVRSEIVGFVDSEGKYEDKLYFNGNILA